MADTSWVGKSISIKCLEPSGSVFQGTIKEVSPEVITIVRAFRNGVPVRKPDTEVKIASANIMSLELIPDTTLSGITTTGVVTKPTPIKHPNLLLQQPVDQNNSFQQYKKTNKVKNNINQFKDHSASVSPQQYPTTTAHQSMLHPIQPAAAAAHNRTAQGTPSNGNKKYFSNSGPGDAQRASVSSQTRPIDIQPMAGPSASSNAQRAGGNNGTMSKSYQEMGSGPNGRGGSGSNNGAGNGNGKNARTSRYQNAKNQTFGTPVNDPTMDEDFDFEKNLALFDKHAIWEKINQQMNSGKPDLLHHPSMGHPGGGGGYSSRQPQPKYRHDENILASAPTQYRQIEVDYNSSRDYVTDEGLIVPSIPLIVRNRVQTAAEARGLTWERQIDILSRGACDTALQLLGGAPRLKPNNQHQWPKIVVICEEPYNERKSEIGICTGRILATHGLKVVIYVKELTGLSRMSYELDLFKATGNEFTTDIADLPSSSDLVIISARASHLSKDITKWVNESRSPVLAIDPPVNGFVNIQAKCSILPILPLDDINMSSCGKLYLCSLGIPVKFFNDAGIKYNSPFGHKYVIPIHVCDQ